MNAIDTNVFVYALDDDEPIKQAAARLLLAQLSENPDSTVIPWQVATELLNNLRKRQAKGRITGPEVRDYFFDYLEIAALLLPRAGALEAYFPLFQQYSLSHWDAMLLAACRDAGVTTLYSEDLDSATDYSGIRVVNPFAAAS